jgi:hypothetical protein
MHNRLAQALAWELKDLDRNVLVQPQQVAAFLTDNTQTKNPPSGFFSD